MDKKKTTCEINLHPSGSVSGVYYSGQELTGIIVLTLYKQKTVKAVYLNIRGVGKCEWIGQRGNSRRIYYGKEQYFTHKTVFFEPAPTDNGQMMIPSGIYSFAFQCELPKHLPTSYEDQIGHIRYLATVHIERTDCVDKTFSTAFTVVKPLNLNANPLYGFPYIKRKTINFLTLMMLKSNNLMLTASMAASGYAPGQTIQLELDVNNKSNQNIYDFRIGFYKVIVYFDTSGKNRKKTKKLLTDIVVDGCPANNSLVFKEDIKVPAVPPTDSHSSKILQISYEIKIKGKVDRGRFKPRIKLPITVGTVPLFSTYRRVHFEDSKDDHFIEPSKYEAAAPELIDEPATQFVPIYPVFNLRGKTRKTSGRLSESSNA